MMPIRDKGKVPKEENEIQQAAALFKEKNRKKEKAEDV